MAKPSVSIPTTDPQILADARWLRRLSSRWPFFLISILSAGLCIYAPMVGKGRLLAKKNLEETTQALRDARPVPLRDSENAALVWKRAIAATVNWDKNKPREDPFAEEANWRESAYYAPDSPARRLLEQNAEALKLADQAAQMSLANWDLDYGRGMAMKLDHLSGMKALARLSALRARVAVFDHNWDMVEKSFHTIQQAGVHIGSDSTLICSLVQINCDRMVLQCMQDYLEIPGAIIDSQMLSRFKFIAHERSTAAIPVFDALKYEQLAGLKLMDQVGEGTVYAGDSAESMQAVPFLFSHYSALYPMDRALFNRSLQILQDKSFQKSHPDVQEYCETIGLDAIIRQLKLTGTILTGLWIGPKAEMMRKEEWRVAEVGLAVLEYHAQHGLFPSSLRDLHLDPTLLSNPFSKNYPPIQSHIGPDGAMWIWCQRGWGENTGRALTAEEFSDQRTLSIWRANNVTFRVPPLAFDSEDDQ